MSGPGRTIEIGIVFDAAIERVTAALAAEGFGVISRIDLDQAFRDKLGVAFRRYAILGACNPSLAHAAVSHRPEVGLLLPCNVVVEESNAGSTVRIADAEAIMGVAGLEAAPEIRELASDASLRLARVAEALSESARQA